MMLRFVLKYSSKKKKDEREREDTLRLNICDKHGQLWKLRDGYTGIHLLSAFVCVQKFSK